MSYRIRHAGPQDAAEIVALATTVGREPQGWLVTDGAWRSVRHERRYLRAVARSAHVAVLVAECERGVVGSLTIARDAHHASAHVADVGLMVAREERRRGIGRALLEAAEAWAREAAISKLELHVFPHNEAALALYERAGYRREGYRRGHFRRGGSLVDAVLMAKELD